MMIEELHLIAGNENPFKNSVITFLSFNIFGLAPIVPSIIAKIMGHTTI